MAAVRHLGFVMRVFGPPRRALGGIYRCAKFGWNRRNSFDKPRLHDRTCCQTGCQTRLTTGLTTGCIVYTAGCQIGCTTRFDNRLNEQWLFIQHVCQTGCQPVLSCKRGYNMQVASF